MSSGSSKKGNTSKGKSGNPTVRSGIYGLADVSPIRRKHNKNKRKKATFRKTKVYGRRKDDFGESLLTSNHPFR